MLRPLFVLFVFTVGMALIQSASADIKISRNNPYRSFNTSGVNYGSMQWEKQHPNNPWPNKNYRYRSGYRANGRWR
jgi:hypothetical protein